ncbi:MAG TPA: membrane protein insertion efficiency factor YidD [Solirubrobacterales bacterium]
MTVSRFTQACSRGLAAALLAPVRLYRRFVSPALPARCKYHPTCSAYAVQAVRELGPARGTVVAAWRLARCNPWSNGGYDPLSDRSLFRPRDEEDPAHDHAGTPGAPA